MIKSIFNQEFFDSIEGAYSTDVDHSGSYWCANIRDIDGNILFLKDSLGYECRFKYNAEGTEIWSEDNVGRPLAHETRSEPTMEERTTKMELTLDTILALLQDK